MFWIRIGLRRGLFVLIRSPNLYFQGLVGLLNYIEPFTIASNTGVHVYYHGLYREMEFYPFGLQIVVDAFCMVRSIWAIPEEAETGTVNESVC
jgi:hypothetical protein